MVQKLAVLSLLAWLAAGSLAHAQARDDRRIGATVTWTAAGAGAGFGIGLWAGLHAFDDAINSDRKVWTSAAVGAAVGALGGYLIGRVRQPKARASTTAPRLLAPVCLKEVCGILSMQGRNPAG